MFGVSEQLNSKHLYREVQQCLQSRFIFRRSVEIVLGKVLFFIMLIIKLTPWFC